MKKLFISTLVSLFAVFILTGCGDKEVKKEKVAYKYTTVQVYEQACIKCHGKHGEGNPEKKTPALNDRTPAEMAQDLYDVKNGGTGFGGGGTEHEVMEHNMNKLVEKGYDYDIDSMAEFLSYLAKNQ